MNHSDQIRHLTGYEERLLVVHDALSALVDDEDALLSALTDPQRLPGAEAMIQGFKRTRDTARHAVTLVRSKLRRLGYANAR